MNLQESVKKCKISLVLLDKVTDVLFSEYQLV